MKTPVDRLIKDMQELKKTKLYASSFKCIDDCLFLAEYYKKEERNQLIDFFLFFRDNGENHIGLTINEFVDLYLKSNVTPESL